MYLFQTGDVDQKRMAMQTAQHVPRIEPSSPVPPAENATPVAPASPVAPEIDQARLYAQEVRSLRHRVAVLEAELAAAKASEQLASTPPLTSIDFAPAAPAAKPAPAVLSQMVVDRPKNTSVFTEHAAPAVSAVTPKPPAPQSLAPAKTASPQAASNTAVTPSTASPNTASPGTGAEGEPVPNPGFAEAWGQDPDATFAEKVAEKAFFQASTVDEESRSWLLES